MARALRNPLELWHLLSLDAPTVAALWCWSLARAVNVRLPVTAPLMLALGTWLLYVCDRLLDGMLATDAGSLRERHRYHLRHRRAFIIAGAMVAGALLWLVCTRMLPRALHENLALAACALVYLGAVHVHSRFLSRIFPKELAVGVVFATATAVPAWSRLAAHSDERAALLPLVALFAALCWLNCVAIEAWESAMLSGSASSAAPPHATTRWIGAHVSGASFTIAFLGLLLFLARWPLRQAMPETMALLLALILSALLFGVLDSMRRRLTPFRLRIAADAALLTPLCVLGVLAR